MIFVFPPSPPNEPPCTVSKKKITPKRAPVRGRTTTGPRAWQFATRNTNTDRCNTTSPRAWCFFFFARAGKNRQVHQNEPPCTVIFVFFRQVHQNEPPCVVSCRVVSCRVVHGGFLFWFFCFGFFCQVHQNEPPCTVIFVFPPSPPNEPPCTVSKKKITPKRTPVRGRTTTRPRAWRFVTRNTNTDRCNTTSPRAWCFFFCPCRKKPPSPPNEPPCTVSKKKNHTKTNPRAWANHDGSPCMAICHAKRQHRQVQHDEPPCMVLFFAPRCVPEKKNGKVHQNEPPCVVSCRVVSCRVVHGDFFFFFVFLPSPPKRAPVCRVVFVSCRVVSCRVKTSPRVRCFLFLFFSAKSTKTSPRVR